MERFNASIESDSNTWQRILALDVRYNGARFPDSDDFPHWYLRRRSQLLRERRMLSSDYDQQWYLAERRKILRSRYGKNPCGTANSVWSEDSSIKMADVGEYTDEQDYSFVGMAHIFDQHVDSAVTCLAFAHRSRSMIALGSADGSVSICSCLSEPPKVDMVLDGLSGPIAKMEWSTNNELIITASQTGLYGHVIVWKVETGEKLRQVEWNKQCNQRLGPLFVASFHTVNNNRVLYGGSILYSLNVSTGQSVQIMDAKVKTTSAVICSNGTYLMIGDEQGGLGMFKTDSNLSQISKIRRFLVAPNKKVSNISIHSQTSSNFLILVSVNDSLMLFSIILLGGRINPIIKMMSRWSTSLSGQVLSPTGTAPSTHAFFDIKANFCPLSINAENGPICVVSGSQQGSVLFFSTNVNQPINALQGHERGVLTATFNYDESLLASSDETGVVIIWRRKREMA